MPLPFIIAGVVIAAIAAAIAYFFTSNTAHQRRNEYEAKVQNVLTLLTEKAKKIIEMLEASQAENEKLKAELLRTKAEMQKMAEELKRWKSVDMQGIGAVSAASFIWVSPVLSAAHYSPVEALGSLDARAKELQAEIESLGG